MTERRDLTFNASGAHGQDGIDGAHGADGGFSGQDGDPGRSATAATPGRHAGTVRVHISSHLTDIEVATGDLRVRGGVRPHGGAPQEYDHLLGQHELGANTPRPPGGGGGVGADGGDGGDGATGRRGKDATRYRSGTNGGPGGDGGRAGSGTNGADAGDGGTCDVSLSIKDTFALVAVRAAEDPSGLIAGGNGGRRGRHGHPGRGGSGGRGGSSYSWTETETYTDSEGNTQTRTTHHSNPGGLRGRRGSPGRKVLFPLYDGADGTDGRYTFHVLDEKGAPHTYPARYDLEVVDFRLAEDSGEDVDGVFEFGEVVHATDLRLRNIGKMPTPAHQRVRLVLKTDEWVRPHPDEIFLEQSLDPGEEATLDGSLRFIIPRPQIKEAGDPFIIIEDVLPIAIQLGPELAGVPARRTPFQRRYPNVTLTREFVARFPVENRDGLVGLRSLAPGERTRMLFRVHNVSNTDIGEHSPRARAVGVQIEYLGGDVGPEAVIFETAADEPLDLTGEVEGFAGTFFRVEHIAAEGDATVEVEFGFREDVPPYSGVTMRASLWLEEFDAPGEWRLVQRREATYRAEPAYRWTPNAHFTLVTNNNTTREGFLAWRELLDDQLELGFDHWSLARYGHFDQQIDLEDGTNLRAHLEDRVAVILNQHFQPRGTAESDLPTDYLLGRDFREGATSNNTHMLIAGAPEFRARQLLEPTSDVRRGGDNFPDTARFLEKEARTGGPLVTETFKEDITTHWDEMPGHDWTFFTTPDDDKREGMFLKRAEELMTRLTEMHPNRRYVLVLHPEEEATRDGRSWLIFPRWKLGIIEVRRTLNTETSSALVLSASDDEINDRDFILDDPNRYAVLLSLSFETKLNRLNWLLQTPDELSGHHKQTMDVLIRAIMADLAEEQDALCRGAGRLDEEVLTQKLSNLGRLTDEPLHTHIPYTSNKWQILFELYAQILALAKAQKPWWKFWGRARKVAAYTLERLEAWSREIFDAYAIGPDGDVAMDSASARTLFEMRAEELIEEFDSLRDGVEEHRGVSWSLGEAARHYYKEPFTLADDLMRDIDAWEDPTRRIWWDYELAQTIEDERARQDKQRQLRELNAETRRTLLADTDEAEHPTEATPEEVVFDEVRDDADVDVAEVEQAPAFSQVAERV